MATKVGFFLVKIKQNPTRKMAAIVQRLVHRFVVPKIRVRFPVAALAGMARISRCYS